MTEDAIINDDQAVLEDDAIIGGMIKRLRTARRVNQTRVAQVLDLPQTVVSRVERGERRLTLRELRLVCELLEVSTLDFVAEYLHRVKPLNAGLDS